MRLRARRAPGADHKVPSGAGPALAAAVSALLLASCGHSAPTRFYTLDARPPAASGPRVPGTGPVRILAVRVPPMLDRLEVARQIQPAVVQVDDLARWSAPLGDLARDALAQDLADRLPGVVILPARSSAPAGARDLTVEILSLRHADQAFELDATVELADAATGVILDHQRVRLSAASGRSDAAAEAEALTRLLADLADRISPRLALTVDALDQG
jgi:uncharacterized lipoprotein YmbA